jgi:hypothetical protein
MYLLDELKTPHFSNIQANLKMRETRRVKQVLLFSLTFVFKLNKAVCLSQKAQELQIWKFNIAQQVVFG